LYLIIVRPVNGCTPTCSYQSHSMKTFWSFVFTNWSSPFLTKVGSSWMNIRIITPNE
jgi:hypothetical protein